MTELKLHLSASRVGRNTQLITAVVCLVVAQLAAGCAASSTHANSEPSPLAISSDALPAGKAQTAYSATLIATGGTAPYTWSLNSGSLPVGLTLSSSLGQISGTPSQAGTSSFGVQVTDSSSPPQTAKAQLSLTVAAATAAAYSAVLSWTASTSSDIVGYNVYRSTVSGGSYGKVNSSPVAGLTYTDSSVVAGQTYYYVTTSVDSSGDESQNSNQVQAVIP
jgi:Putative Ig domain